jgi:hypothetical protein
LTLPPLSLPLVGGELEREVAPLPRRSLYDPDLVETTSESLRPGVVAEGEWGTAHMAAPRRRRSLLFSTGVSSNWSETSLFLVSLLVIRAALDPLPWPLPVPTYTLLLDLL